LDYFQHMIILMESQKNDLAEEPGLWQVKHHLT